MPGNLSAFRLSAECRNGTLCTTVVCIFTGNFRCMMRDKLFPFGHGGGCRNRTEFINEVQRKDCPFGFAVLFGSLGTSTVEMLNC
jgi:hypothetical protein